MTNDKIWLFDTTLRDGGQTRGVDFSQADKVSIAAALDEIGIDYIEGGWPGANPTDDAFFGNPPKTKNAKMVAFGMTRRGGRSTANDPGLNAVLDAEVGTGVDKQVDHLAPAVPARAVQRRPVVLPRSRRIAR